LGVLELNVMLPVMARNLLESVGLSFRVDDDPRFKVRRRDRAEPGAVRGTDRAEPAMVTRSRCGSDIICGGACPRGVPRGKTIRALLAEKGVLTADEIDRILDPRTMI